MKKNTIIVLVRYITTETKEEARIEYDEFHFSVFVLQ